MSRHTPPEGTKPVDIAADPPVPDWTDLPNFGDGNGQGGDYGEIDLRLSNLEIWLQSNSVTSIQDALAKAREYGGDSNGDLDIMAGAMHVMLPNLRTHQQALCAVLAFYQLGKVSRSLAALANGTLPSSDTARDTAVYATMQQRVQENGSWL